MSEKSFELKKNSQIYTLVFLLKLFAIFFSAMAMFQYIFKDITFRGVLQQFTLLSVLIALAVMTLMLVVWLFVFYNFQTSKKSVFFEIPVFFALLITAQAVSGLHESYYKFLFMFIIVSYTIERGTRVGVWLGAVSSIIILGIDLIFGNTADVNPYFENDIALSAMFISVAWILGYYVRLERGHIDHLKEQANVDGLTGLYNHRFFHEEFKRLFQHCQENHLPISLIMIDIDFFKTYNDIYGHQQGDEVLRLISSIFKEHTDPEYPVFRYGGEEFAIVLPNATQKRAMQTAEYLRKLVSNYHFEGEENLNSGRLTISAGVAESLPQGDSYTKMITRADAALYRAKYLHRNRVEIYSSIIDKFNQKAGKTEIDNVSNDAFHSLKTLITVINSRDSYTYNHIERVVYYCEVISDYLNLSENEKRDLIYAAYLHDLGKINVPPSILLQTKPLTAAEWRELRKHPKDSASIVSQIRGLEGVVPIVQHHHERFDGSGYPDGLAGEEISYLTRILTLADAFDAMTNDRPYKAKINFEAAFEELRNCAGTQFDPVLTEQFITAIQQTLGTSEPDEEHLSVFRDAIFRNVD